MRLALIVAAGALALGCTRRAENAAENPPAPSGTVTPSEREQVRGGQRLPSDTAGTPGSNVRPTPTGPGSQDSRYDGTGTVTMPPEANVPGTSDVIGRPGSTAAPTTTSPAAAADAGLPANPTGAQGTTNQIDTTSSPGTTLETPKGE